MDSTRTTIDQARALFDLYEDAMRPLQAPLRNLMGNHDIAGVANPAVAEHEPDFGKALYRRRFGPATYAFRHGRHHFIALDGTMLQERAIVYGLTRQSADWAIRYLAGVERDEPVVLLIHEPMFPEKGGVRQPDTPGTRPHEARLQAALAGKKLLFTLAGHAHTRSETSWAGAPHILGGAVSYAWHGLLPYPPAPRGYLLFRVDGDRTEHVYLDWAEQRSIDITTPAFQSLASGGQPIRGLIADPAREITTVRCALADRTAPATTARRGALATAFDAMLDTAGLADGAYDLIVTATADGHTYWTERQPVIVVNGAPGRFAPAGDATLAFRMEGALPPGTRILCNGQILAAGPVGHGAEMRCAVPAKQLRRLNEVVIDPGPAEKATQTPILKGVTLEHDGKRRRDVRHSPLARRPLRGPVVSWIDLVYEEPAP
jgi:hypothetical protein